MSDQIQSTDVVIIGAGPVGMFAIFECGMLGMKCHVVDALDMVGGQCAALYPEKPIYDIPAHPMVSGGDLIENLKKQAEPFDPVYHLNQRVESLNRVDNDEWIVTTNTGNEIRTKAIIIAAGVGAFGPNRPPIEGIEAYEGESVQYFVKKREDYRGKKIVIAGGGDSAVDWVNSLAELAEKIYVVHRRPKFRAAPESVSQMEALSQGENSKVEMVIPYQLSGLKGEGNQISHVTVADLEGNERDLEADILLPFFGLAMNLGPIAEWGLELENKHLSVNPRTAQTSAPGVYAIGDIAHYENKLKLILTGFAEAAQAAHSIRQLVFPDQVFHFEYSTTSGVPGAQVNKA